MKLALYVLLFLTLVVGVLRPWIEEEKKCEAYGKAHGIPTSYYPADGCVSITVKVLYK